MRKITLGLCVFIFGTTLSFAQSLSRLNSTPFEKTKLQIEGMYFDVSDTGNNSELSEIGCTVFRNKYLITSNKKRGFAHSHKNSETGLPNNNIFCADILYNNDLDVPLVFSKVLNSREEQGGLTFSVDGNTIYFTRSKEDDSNLFSLYKADLNLDYKYYWENIEELRINSDEYSIETPFIGKSNASKIYFSSNKSGGYGGYDLYEADISKSGHIVNVKNLGPSVNSKKDEKYPFVDETGRYFYFSSNGYKGYGNYDVYRTSVKNNMYTNLTNLGNSLNTVSDDVAFYLTESNTGFISTNEINDVQDFNVYKFRIIEIPQNIEINVSDLKDGKPLANADVLILDEYNDVVKKTKTDQTGKIKFKGSLLSEYSIAIDKNNYIKQEAEFQLNGNNLGQNQHKFNFELKEYPFSGKIVDADTKKKISKAIVTIYNKDKEVVSKMITDEEGSFKFTEAPQAPFYIAVNNLEYYNTEFKIEEDLTKGATLQKELELIKVEAEIVKNAVVVNNKKYDAIGVTNILFDFDKAIIKQESYEPLHKVFNLMRARNDVEIIVNAHTDLKGSNAYNNKLSQERAVSVYNYLVGKGISRDRISYKSYGKKQPLVKCGSKCDEEDDAKNRRVEFIIKQ